MLILLPVLILILAAYTLVSLYLVRPTFRYPWIIAAAGSSFALLSVFLWQTKLPQSLSLTPLHSLFKLNYTIGLIADDISWSYAISLAALCAAVIWTSVVRAEKNPINWAGVLLQTALGILAVASENPATLIFTWSALDLVELITLLRSTTGNDQNRSVVIAFSVRILGSGLLLWANLTAIGHGASLSFHSLPATSGLLLLFAACLRLGVIPLHLPNQQASARRRGFGTILRLVSAAASLSLLARITPGSLLTAFAPFLLVLVAIVAIFAGWLWLSASDEIVGRPFWILGSASLAIGATLRGNSTASLGWGVTLILSGGLLFLFSARLRQVLWLPLLAILSFSALPYTATSSAWLNGNTSPVLFLIPFLPAQGLLMAGYIRHALHPGDSSLESQATWTKVLYPTGLFLLAGTAFLLGFWGWNGSRVLGSWWMSLIALLFAAGFYTLALLLFPRLSLRNISVQWTLILHLEWLPGVISSIFRGLRSITVLVTSALEGDGGLLWSLTLIAVILSVLSTWGH
jgi:hypothetical protein